MINAIRLSQRRNLLRNKKGFTLVELIVTVLLMTAVLFAILNIFDFTWLSFTRVTGDAATQSELRLIMDVLEEKVRVAGGVHVVQDAAAAAGMANPKTVCSVNNATGVFTISDGTNTRNFHPVKGLLVELKAIGTTTRLLSIKLTSGDGYTIQKEVYTQNASITYHVSTGSALILYSTS